MIWWFTWKQTYNFVSFRPKNNFRSCAWHAVEIFFLHAWLPLYQTAKPLSQWPVLHRTGPHNSEPMHSAIRVKYSTVYSRVILWAELVQVPSPSSLQYTQYTQSLIGVVLPPLPQKTGMREIKAASQCLMPTYNYFVACTQIFWHPNANGYWISHQSAQLHFIPAHTITRTSRQILLGSATSL